LQVGRLRVCTFRRRQHHVDVSSDAVARPASSAWCGWKGEWKIVNVLWELKPGAAK
jgi:hypothetical protein